MATTNLNLLAVANDNLKVMKLPMKSIRNLVFLHCLLKVMFSTLN